MSLDREQDHAARRTAPLKQMVDEYRAGLIESALEAHGWHITRTAAYLEVGREGLYKMIQRYGIVKPGAGV